ncbi:hypothetical protein AAA539_19980 [Pseudomonas aeruginosa]
MNIYECERLARDLGYDRAKFTAIFPAGPFECQWLDAYMGIFKVDAEGMRDGFVMVKEMAEMFPNLECIDLRVEEDV